MREVLHLNLPDSFHTEFGIFHALNALDVVLCQDSGRTTEMCIRDRFGDYLLLRRIDFYADACHQTFNQKGTAELVLSQDRTFLRRDEHDGTVCLS